MKPVLYMLYSVVVAFSLGWKTNAHFYPVIPELENHICGSLCSCTLVKDLRVSVLVCG